MADAPGVESPVIGVYERPLPEIVMTPSTTISSPAEPAIRRPELIGRGAAVGYTGSFSEQSTVDIQEVVAEQSARGPE